MPASPTRSGWRRSKPVKEPVSRGPRPRIATSMSGEILFVSNNRKRLIPTIADIPDRREKATVLRPHRSRQVLLIATGLIVGGCVQDSTDEITLIELPATCGVHAALDVRQPENLRDKPPACALPVAEEVAMSCAVHDLVTGPDYRPPAYNEEGFPTDEQPIPEYRVSNLSCHFSTRQRNEAFCQFQLRTPGGAEESRNVVVRFEHRFWRDDGPTHHWYGTRWSATTRCTPLDQ